MPELVIKDQAISALNHVRDLLVRLTVQETYLITGSGPVSVGETPHYHLTVGFETLRELKKAGLPEYIEGVEIKLEVTEPSQPETD